MDYYRKACDEGNIAEACHRYSALFIRGTKGACDKNMKEAFTYSLKGDCQLLLFISTQQRLKVCKNVVSACELGNLGGCVNVSQMYSKGDGVEKNPVAAKEYGDIAKEMMDQLKEQQRIAFQEGAEQ